jgi:hypothetical protein
MSEIQVGQINSTDGSTAITTGADGYVSFAKTQIGGRRNLIINGAMQVAQRGTSVASLNSTGYYTLDRWIFLASVGTAALTMSQSSDVPDGFANSLKLEVTTADTALDADVQYGIDHRIESQDLQHLAYGTASAKTTTLSFWAKSSKTGIYTIWVYSPDGGRHATLQYTINSANTWEYKQLTIYGDASGTLINDNGEGFRMRFGLAIGSDYQGGTITDGVWESLVNSNRNAGQVNFVDTVGATFYITGVQLEVGSVATPFEHRSFGEELALCQRYYQRIDYGSTPTVICNGFYYTSTHIRGVYNPPVVFRGTPSLDVPNSTNVFSILRNGTVDTFDTLLTANSSPSAVSVYQNTGVSGTTGWAGLIRMQTADAYFGLEAEL